MKYSWTSRQWRVHPDRPAPQPVAGIALTWEHTPHHPQRILVTLRVKHPQGYQGEPPRECLEGLGHKISLKGEVSQYQYLKVYQLRHWHHTPLAASNRTGTVAWRGQGSFVTLCSHSATANDPEHGFRPSTRSRSKSQQASTSTYRSAHTVVVHF